MSEIKTLENDDSKHAPVSVEKWQWREEISTFLENNDRINSYLVESISNIETIKGSHQEKRFIDKFKIKYQLFLEKNYAKSSGYASRLLQLI